MEGKGGDVLFADLVVLNGNIITVDGKNPRAEALATKGEKIVAVGATSEIKELIGKDTKVIDARGGTITPGFIDAHCHPTYAARGLLKVDCSPTKVRTIGDIGDALKERAKITAKGKWIQGFGYDDTKLAEKRHPTRWDLDKASTEHPIYITQVGGHIGVINSKALEIAKITKDTPDPDGGEFGKDKNGELTGVCRERANFIFSGIGLPPGEPSSIPSPTKEEDREAFCLVCEKYLSAGITSVGDALVNPSEIELYQDALEEGLLPMRVYMMVWVGNLAHLKELKLRTGFGNDRLKLGTIKMLWDGSITGRTAYLYEPYEGRDDCGLQPPMTQEELDKKIFEVHEAGFQLAVHANGDRAIDMLLNSYEKALNKLPRVNHRHRIEHCSVVNPRIVKRIKELGVVAIPHSTHIYEHGDKLAEFGSRISMMFAFRSFLDYGIPVAGHSDHPVTSINPLLGIQTMVTRKTMDGEVLGPEQKISVEEAIRIYTLGSAYASFEENIKGSVEVGKLADFVVLSNDLTKVDPDTIKDIKVEKTVVGGEIVYERE